MTVLTIDGIPITKRVHSILSSKLLMTPYHVMAKSLHYDGVIEILVVGEFTEYKLTAKGKRILDKLNGKII